MTKRIAVVGAGALGGYVGGTLAHLGHDVTLIDPWPENVETIRARGLELDGMTPEERFTVRKAKTLHITEVQALAKTPIDVAMVAMKSYDTAWACASARRSVTSSRKSAASSPRSSRASPKAIPRRSPRSKAC